MVSGGGWEDLSPLGLIGCGIGHYFYFYQAKRIKQKRSFYRRVTDRSKGEFSILLDPNHSRQGTIFTLPLFAVDCIAGKPRTGDVNRAKSRRCAKVRQYLGRILAA